MICVTAILAVAGSVGWTATGTAQSTRRQYARRSSECGTTRSSPASPSFVSIPALSPIFDANWADSGHLDAAVEHVRRWLVARNIEGATAEILRLPGKTPVLLLDVPPAGEVRADAGTVLLYGHLDKQPPVGGWAEGLGPWTPVLRDGRLYGRGAADDGYSGYAATTAIEALRAAGGSARAVRGAAGDQRGVRQPGPAGLPRAGTPTGWARCRWWCAWTPAARTTSGCG